jgi:hypothetical protein
MIDFGIVTKPFLDLEWEQADAEPRFDHMGAGPLRDQHGTGSGIYLVTIP